MEISEGIFKMWIPDSQAFPFSQEICSQELPLWPVLGVHTSSVIYPQWSIAWQHTGACREGEFESAKLL